MVSSMRERVARAMAARYFDYKQADQCWNELSKDARKNWIGIAKAALDVLTANPGEAILDAALGRETRDENGIVCFEPMTRGEMFCAMIRAIKSGK